MHWLLYHRIHNGIALLSALAKPKFIRRLYLAKPIMPSLWIKPQEADWDYGKHSLLVRIINVSLVVLGSQTASYY